MPQDHGSSDSSSAVISARHPMVEYQNPHNSGEERVQMLSFGQPTIAAGEVS